MTGKYLVMLQHVVSNFTTLAEIFASGKQHVRSLALYCHRNNKTFRFIPLFPLHFLDTSQLFCSLFKLHRLDITVLADWA